MKKITSLLVFILTLTLLSSFGCITAISEDLTSNYVDVIFSITPNDATLFSVAEFSLSDGENTYTASAPVSATSTEIVAHFDVPDFTPGRDFNFKVLSGLDCIMYYEYTFNTGDTLNLWTYTDIVDGIPKTNSTFYMSATPTSYKDVYFFKDYQSITPSHKLMYINGILYAPFGDIATAVGITNVTYNDQTGQIGFGVYNNNLYMTVGSTEYYGSIGTGALDGAPVVIEEYPYVPVKSFCSIFDVGLEIQNEGDYMNCNLSSSALVQRETEARNRAAFVNNQGISSRTSYLIWVSKAEYKLRVYTGSAGNWKLEKEFPVGIGKASTPTCTGQYEYYQYQQMWPYSSYYVGPVMRFNGGYAIHSTLQKYNGTPYDDTVGKKVSHGCVRVQKANMNWLASMVPMYTKIYITES